MTETANQTVPGVAVIGSGRWGRNLVRNFHALGALTLVCDQDRSLLQSLAGQYPGLTTSTSGRSAMDRHDVDAVAIATPAGTHYQLALEALRAGKHVFLEKPPALSTAQLGELVGLADDEGLVLMVGHLMQYHPVFARLRQMVTEGRLGQIRYICSHRLDLGRVRRPENVLWSFGPHDVSMLLALAGQDPESVQATGGDILCSGVADVSTLHLEFASGIKANVFVSWLYPFKEQKLVVVGEEMMAVFDDTKPWQDKLVISQLSIDTAGGVPSPVKSIARRVAVAPAEPLFLECRHFIESIATGRRPLTDGQEGLRVLRVLDAGQRSMDAGGQKVNLAVGDTGCDRGGYFVHPTAVVDPGVSVGAGSRIWHFAHLLSGTSIGPGCNLGQNVVVGPDVTLGKGCKIQNNVLVCKGVTLEDHVFCGHGVSFTNVKYPRAAIRKMDQLIPTVVRQGATIGAGAVIVCGVTIGRNAFVGAGAVVTRDVPGHALVVGNPARQVGWVCQCGCRLDQDGRCRQCGRHYAHLRDESRPGSGGADRSKLPPQKGVTSIGPA